MCSGGRGTIQLRADPKDTQTTAPGLHHVIDATRGRPPRPFRNVDAPPAAVRPPPSPPCSVYQSLSIVPVGALTPPFAQERLRLRRDGRVALELKTAWHDGTRELVFEPLEFLERLAAMTPRPKTNLLICHGVLAPRARWRARVVVYGRRVPEPTASTAPLATGPDCAGVKSSPRAWSWAALMHRAFGIDVLACGHCGGRLRLIATLHDPAVIRKILAHLALAHSGQSPGPAPPTSSAAAS